ncbi:MAG: PaaI family thioesterase [Rhodospirillales bacterium]|nr:PaaI family thioesterase [Rhodospirillales bacterium]
MAGLQLRPEITPAHMNKRALGSLIAMMGVTYDRFELGRVVTHMQIRPDHLAPNGFLHAAAVIALADSSCGGATIAHLPMGAENFTTIELKSNHLGTATDGILDCLATNAHSGRTTQVWDAVVTARESARTIALFRCTQMILWPK